jgi:hypothetical protein
VRNEKIKAEQESYQQIERYITENRLHNVESKIGPLKEENIKVI